MNKQELMKFAQNPFWVRLRLFLFILFWVVWLAMLVGAVAIIALAPGCPATASLPWWSKCSLSQVEVRGDIKKREVQATVAQEAKKDLDGLSTKLNSIHAANIEGVVISGLSPFLLHVSEGADIATEAAVNDFKDSLIKLVEAAHDEKLKMKIVLELDVRSSPDNIDWFVTSVDRNNTDFTRTYIWQKENKSNVSNIFWNYNTDNFHYYASRKQNENTAFLNYGDEHTKELMKRLVIGWIRTKIDGVQLYDGFYEQDAATNEVRESVAPIAYLRKQIKATGEKKSFLVVSEKEAAARVPVEADMQPTWNMFTLFSSPPVVDKLNTLFRSYEKKDNDSAALVGPDVEASKNEHWNAWYALMLTAKNNKWVSQHSMPVAEGLTVALHLMPRSTPVFQLDADQLEQGLAPNGTNSVVFKIAEIRDQNLETFLLGRTHVLPTDNQAVFAVYRAFEKSSSFIFVLNTDNLTRTVSLNVAPLRAAGEPHEVKVVLADSSHQAELGRTVDLTKVKLEPNQWLLLQFVASG